MPSGASISGTPDLSGFAERLRATVDARRPVIRAIVMQSATNDYMRDAGFGASRRARSDRGPLRIVSGRLSRGLLGSGPEAVSRFSWRGTIGEVVFGSRTPYAGVHEDGYFGTVSVPSHSRTITSAFGRPVPPTTVTVKSHTRTMAIPARAYLRPAVRDTAQRVNDELAGAILEALAT